MTIPEFAAALAAASAAVPPARAKAEFLTRLRAELDATAPGWRDVRDPESGQRLRSVELHFEGPDGRPMSATLFTSPEAADDGV